MMTHLESLIGVFGGDANCDAVPSGLRTLLCVFDFANIRGKKKQIVSPNVEGAKIQVLFLRRRNGVKTLDPTTAKRVLFTCFGIS